jgi:hypothetical protein
MATADWPIGARRPRRVRSRLNLDRPSCGSRQHSDRCVLRFRQYRRHVRGVATAFTQRRPDVDCRVVDPAGMPLTLPIWPFR